MYCFNKKAEDIENLIRNEFITKLSHFLRMQGYVCNDHILKKSMYTYIPGLDKKTREKFLGKKDLPKFLASINKTKIVFQKALKRFLLIAINSLLIYCCNKFNKIILFKIISDKSAINKMVEIIHLNLDKGILIFNSLQGEKKDNYFFQDIIIEKINNQAIIIEEWWIDIYYSPYTKIGKKRLMESYNDLIKDYNSSNSK